MGKRPTCEHTYAHDKLPRYMRGKRCLRPGTFEICGQFFCCAHAAQVFARGFVLSDAQRWVLCELVHNTAMHTEEDKARYCVHKCEKNGCAKQQCIALLEAMNLHYRFCSANNCPVCSQLAKYRQAE